MNAPTDDQVTAAGIARRAGVGRAAVSNWRKRHPDEFPQPVDGYFSWDEVRRWLTATGKAGQLATVGRTGTGTQRIDGVAPETIGGHRVIRRARARESPRPDQLLARTMAALLPLPEDVGSPEHGSQPDAGAPPVVLDPACADGTLLAAVADCFGDHVTLVGHDTDEPAASGAAALLREHAREPRYEIHAGEPDLDNRLAPYTGTAAAVLCRAPTSGDPAPAPTADPRWGFGAPVAVDADLAWVLCCLSLLRPRGIAVVTLSPSAATRSSGREIRTGLVRSGVLRDVIALPTGADGPLHLWVLQRPLVDDAPVRMADLSGLAVAGDLPADRGEWNRLLGRTEPGVVRAVRRLELLDGETSLLPAQHVGLPAAPGVGELGALIVRVRAAYERIGRAFPDPVASARRARRTITVAELERSGALRIRTRDTTPREGDVLLRNSGHPPLVATGTADDDKGVAQVVEIRPEQLDAHFLALFLRVDVGAAPVANTHGAISRDDLRRCRVPRMPLIEQRRYGDELRHVVALEGALSALQAVGRGVLEQTLHGLTTGDLLPSAIADRETIATDRTKARTE